jgi:hypothetical protein
VIATRPLLAFWRKLLLGDDWRLTVGPLLALALTALLHDHGLSLWWLLPAAVALVLAVSVRYAAKQGRHVPR